MPNNNNVTGRELSRHEWTYAYAKLDQVEDYLRLGWLPHDSLSGCVHGQYAVYVEWLCECRTPMPIK